MLATIAQSAGRFIVGCLARVAWWLVCFPLFWLAALPVVLILALFRPKPYGRAVLDMLLNVHDWWGKWGMEFL